MEERGREVLGCPGIWQQISMMGHRFGLEYRPIILKGLATNGPL